jgi:dipeptidyl aminopeptidase/acylaminoacyl peptidase
MRITVISLALVACLLAPALADTLERPDGTRITWYLDVPAHGRYPLVVILQGSECLRVSDKYGPWIRQLVEAGLGVLRVEKPGLGPDTPIGKCPDEYLRLNTVDRRVLDLLAVVAALRGRPGWDGRLCVLGGSEGGSWPRWPLRSSPRPAPWS